MSRSRFWAIVPAAGIGRRMGGGTPKQYLDLNGRPVIEHTIARLLANPDIEAVYVALSDTDHWWKTTCFASYPAVLRVLGGQERCDSVLNALKALASQAADGDWVLVHDAARPCLMADDLAQLIGQLKADPVGGLLASPIHDTVKVSTDLGWVKNTLPREQLWRAFTPQMFRYSMLRDALESALARGMLVTDEASAMEQAGHSPRLVEGDSSNIKITRPEDLALAAFFLAKSANKTAHPIVGQKRV